MVFLSPEVKGLSSGVSCGDRTLRLGGTSQRNGYAFLTTILLKVYCYDNIFSELFSRILCLVRYKLIHGNNVEIFKELMD